MPAVSKSRKSKAKKKTPAKSRRAPARRTKSSVNDRMGKIWSDILTYAAVALCVVTLATVLMLAAGGYFANFGDRFDSLSGRAAKAMGFSVNRVAVRGQGSVSDREIMAALKSPEKGEVLGQSLLNLDPVALREKVEQLSWVKTAAVQKLWPDTVHVTIIERAPVAVWQDRELAFHLIDAEGQILDFVPDSEDVGLPIVSKTDDPAKATDVLMALSAHPELYARVAAVVSINDRRFDLRFRNDFTAKLPEQDLAASLQRLERLGAGTGKLAESLQYLDLRNPDWAYFQRKSS